MQRNIKSVILTFLIAVLLPTISIAEGLTVSSDGGLKVGSSSDPYWFQVGGVVKLDQRSFFGKTDGTPYTYVPSTQNGGRSQAGTYMSGAFLRALELDLSGGVGENYTYSAGLDFDTNDKEVALDFAFVTFHAYKDLMPNFTFSIGQVFPGFCISCASSSKWIPFMERNMGTNTFTPKPGLGISFNSYDNNYSGTVAITQQPKSGSSVKSVNGVNMKARDLWQVSGRFTYAPIAEAGRLLQFGASAHIQEYSNTGLEFKANPEMKTNNSTTLLNTTYANSVGTYLISARNQKTIDFEITGVRGPWSGEVEYQQAFVTRGAVNTGADPKAKQGANLTFNGYHAQISYVLTGESRPHRKSNGTLGQIKPHSKKGAWEVSARYSVINLNNKDIAGGKANNTTASLSWYANNNLRVIGEYVFSKQSRQYPTYLDKRNVSGLGARLQVVF